MTRHYRVSLTPNQKVCIVESWSSTPSHSTNYNNMKLESYSVEPDCKCEDFYYIKTDGKLMRATSATIAVNE